MLRYFLRKASLLLCRLQLRCCKKLFWVLGKFLGVGCHCFPPPLDVPTFSARFLYVQRRDRPLAAESGTLHGREMFRQISSRIRLPRNSRDLLHAANLWHGKDGFTSPPKEGVLRIFSPLKIRRLRPGLNPADLGTKGQHATSRPPNPIIYSYHHIMEPNLLDEIL